MYAPFELSLFHFPTVCGISIKLLDFSPTVPSDCPIKVVLALERDMSPNFTPKLLGKLASHCI